MGSFPFGKTIPTFDPKSLQIDSTSEISVVKRDARTKKSSKSDLITNSIEHIQKDDPNHFIFFLSSKFDALKELSLNDELDDGNPIEIRKVDIDKKIFPKKHKHVKFSNIKNSKERLNVEKTRKKFSCENVIERKFCKIDNLKEKSNFDHKSDFNLHEDNSKSPKKSKFHHHKKYCKSVKNKNLKKNLSLSTIKSIKSDHGDDLNDDKDGQKNVKDSLDPIRAILKEMGN